MSDQINLRAVHADKWRQALAMIETDPGGVGARLALATGKEIYKVSRMQELVNDFDSPFHKQDIATINKGLETWAAVLNRVGDMAVNLSGKKLTDSEIELLQSGPWLDWILDQPEPETEFPFATIEGPTETISMIARLIEVLTQAENDRIPTVIATFEQDQETGIVTMIVETVEGRQKSPSDQPEEVYQ